MTTKSLSSDILTRKHDNKLNLSNPTKSIISGALAGALESSITYPLEYTKSILQLQSMKPELFISSENTLSNVIYNTYNKFGIIGFYRGLQSYVYFSLPRTAVRFTVFEQTKVLQLSSNESTNDFISGLMAGIIYDIYFL